MVEPNFGVGFRIYQFYIDYALSKLGGNQYAMYSHVVSAKLNINFDYIKKNLEKPIISKVYRKDYEIPSIEEN